MSEPFESLPRHRQMIAFLATGLDCLEEAIQIDATLGVMPHWARMQVRAMAEELADLLTRVARESPVLAPLRDEELLADAVDAEAAP